jgi:UDP-galactopyranose mutase
MDLYKHRAWHLLFSNKSISAIISYLKTFNNINHFMESINNYYKWNALKLLFGFKNLKQIIELLERVKSIKEIQSKIKIKFKIAA